MASASQQPGIRKPLTTRDANVSFGVTGATEGTRCRILSPSGKWRYFVSPPNESGDGRRLQGKAQVKESLESKIASIRTRNAHEDEPAVKKKRKLNGASPSTNRRASNQYHHQNASLNTTSSVDYNRSDHIATQATSFPQRPQAPVTFSGVRPLGDAASPSQSSSSWAWLDASEFRPRPSHAYAPDGNAYRHDASVLQRACLPHHMPYHASVYQAQHAPASQQPGVPVCQQPCASVSQQSCVPVFQQQYMPAPQQQYAPNLQTQHAGTHQLPYVPTYHQFDPAHQHQHAAIHQQQSVSASRPQYETFCEQPRLPIVPRQPSASVNCKQPVQEMRSVSAMLELSGVAPKSTTSAAKSQKVPAGSTGTRKDMPVLCQEQQGVVDLILAGRNVFYTGSAGCGKSTVLKVFVPQLRELGKRVRIIAPTGRAALDINGSTFWTFAGWTPMHMKKPLADLQKAAHGKFVSQRLRSTDVLIIDEVSMMENHHFERLNQLLKAARGNDAAFGGLQLIVTGDFCQLPPVRPFQYCIDCGREQVQKRGATGNVVYKCFRHGEHSDADKWAFRSKAWQECGFSHVNLTEIHRQSDEVFIKILQKLRIGTPITEADRRLLLDHPCDVKDAVKLFPTREEVKRINQAEFDKLKTVAHKYMCLDHFHWNQEKHPHLQSKGNRSPFDRTLDALREHRLDPLVEYKKGMLVVLLANLDIEAGLVNGSQGRVVGFEPYDVKKMPKARQTMRDRSAPERKNRDDDIGLPNGMQKPGQPDELRGEHALLRQSLIQNFLDDPRNANSRRWPIVEFDNGVKRTIYADCQINELGDEEPYSLLARTQIPLVAAWAMTIHKSQGMTLNRVIVDLGKSFEEGQEYVALSRARSLSGLKVESLGAGVGKAGNPQVREFLWNHFKLK